MPPTDLEGTATAVGSVQGLTHRIKDSKDVSVSYRQYQGEEDLLLVTSLIDNELSEPYSIFTYRFFLHNWPKLCWLAFDGERCFGTVVCKQDRHGELQRGYIAMLVVETAYRGLGVGTELVRRSIEQMRDDKADEVVLEAEVTNGGALALYQNLGFIRDKYLVRYYLSGSDAFRLKLMLPLPEERLRELQEEQLVAEELSRMSLEAAEGPSTAAANGSRPDSVEKEAGKEATSSPGTPHQSSQAAGEKQGSKRKSKKGKKRAKG